MYIYTFIYIWYSPCKWPKPQNTFFQEKHKKHVFPMLHTMCWKTCAQMQFVLVRLEYGAFPALEYGALLARLVTSHTWMGMCHVARVGMCHVAHMNICAWLAHIHIYTLAYIWICASHMNIYMNICESCGYGALTFIYMWIYVDMGLYVMRMTGTYS